jgi:D-threo-aldose 1-dehydrogenase
VRTRALGATGLVVTELCVGTSAMASTPVYGYRVAEEQALDMLRRVFRGPFTFVDTSNEYGVDGSGERLVGTVLREIGGVPDGVVVATKVDPDAGGDFSGRRVHASVRESRDRLGTDGLPLVYLHDPERIPFAEAMAPDGPVAALRSLRDDGTIGHLGVAGGPVDLLRRYVATGVFEVVLTHNRFTLLDRSARPLLQDCAAAGVAVVNAAPFGAGLLAKGPDVTDRYGYRSAPTEIMDAARRMQAACDRHGIPLAAALQFSLRDPRITATVVGFTRAERVDQTLELARRPIPDALWRELRPAPEAVWLG